ncbi:MAG: NAD(P)H-binding protein [Anaerolineales bacterium]|nr:NAD(P)H-binding protein [Anaerolineales bacterium]
MPNHPSPPRLLVTGATGYIASRLIPLLLEKGYTVRCLARQPERLRARKWYQQVEITAGDVTRPESLPKAMQGIHTAYYLIHSMSAGHGYEHLDLQAARNFAQAARAAGIEHIIYVGGLADPAEPNLALHLKSRLETGDALREAGVPVTEFRAGVIVGPGSVSFEMIRFIAEQFPLMVGPLWLKHRSQPIATPDILAYLVTALETPACRGQIIEIGCERARTYIDIMTEYARIRGLKRFPLLLPFVPPVLMAFFIDKLTPVNFAYALPLVEGLKNNSLVKERTPLRLFPGIQPMDYAEAVRRALADTHPEHIERIWLDCTPKRAFLLHEGMFVDYRCLPVPVTGLPTDVFLPGIRFEQDKRCSETLLRLKACLSAGTLWVEWNLTRTNTESGWHEESKQPEPKLDCQNQIDAENKLTTRKILEQTLFFLPNGLPGALFGYFILPLLARHAANKVQKTALQTSDKRD